MTVYFLPCFLPYHESMNDHMQNTRVEQWFLWHGERSSRRSHAETPPALRIASSQSVASPRSRHRITAETDQESELSPATCDMDPGYLCWLATVCIDSEYLRCFASGEDRFEILVFNDLGILNSVDDLVAVVEKVFATRPFSCERSPISVSPAGLLISPKPDRTCSAIGSAECSF